jgi:hypothetical protein
MVMGAGASRRPRVRIDWASAITGEHRSRPMVGLNQGLKVVEEQFGKKEDKEE